MFESSLTRDISVDTQLEQRFLSTTPYQLACSAVDADALCCSLLIATSPSPIAIKCAKTHRDQMLSGLFNIAIIPKGFSYFIDKETRNNCIIIEVKQSMVNAIFSGCNEFDSWLNDISFCDDPDTAVLSSLVYKQYEHKRENLDYLQALISALLVKLFSKDLATNIDNKSICSIKLNQIITELEGSISNKANIAAIASKVGMSTTVFYRNFKSATGLSPYQYIMQRRIIKAKKMLIDNELSLAEIAYESGFASQSHMTDVFREKLGITPGSLCPL